MYLSATSAQVNHFKNMTCLTLDKEPGEEFAVRGWNT
jgi:hypothetical protein